MDLDLINVKKLVLSEFSEPSFFVNFFKIVRPPSARTDDSHKILKTNKLVIWTIEDEKLIKSETVGIFFDSESYLIQWLFDLQVDNTILEELLVYYWKGQSASKGFSPLPSEIEEHCPVERIVQWSEPAIFFYGFTKSAIVFCGKKDIFDAKAPHLLLIRGEILQEIHLYEIPCEKRHLRSRASYLLVLPNKYQFIYWHGSQTSYLHRKNIKEAQPHNNLKEWQEGWTQFEVQELEENSRETKSFLETLNGDLSDYIHIKVDVEFSPKLFYLNSITGNFLATEVQYPLRSANNVAPFPFLQSHLYTATQPAFFLLDNNTDIWLWEGVKDSNLSNYDDKKFAEEKRLSQELLHKYVEEKEKELSRKIAFYHVFANQEPLEFKSIFPLWKEN